MLALVYMFVNPCNGIMEADYAAPRLLSDSYRQRQVNEKHAMRGCGPAIHMRSLRYCEVLARRPQNILCLFCTRCLLLMLVKSINYGRSKTPRAWEFCPLIKKE